jgi:hypothetical protein
VPGSTRTPFIRSRERPRDCTVAGRAAAAAGRPRRRAGNRPPSAPALPADRPSRSGVRSSSLPDEPGNLAYPQPHSQCPDLRS